MEKCDICIKYIKTINSAGDENYKLQKLIEHMVSEINDKTAIIEDIRQILGRYNSKEIDAKSTINTLINKMIK